MAESALQLRQFDTARKLFDLAASRYPEQQGQLAVALRQARRLLEAFTWPEDKIDLWIASIG